MTYSVTEVSHSRQMKDFLNLPFIIYRYDTNWVPPVTSEVRRILDERLNPYFSNAQLKLFVCYKDGAIVSRIAVVINRLHYQKFGIKSAFFGFFESIEDPDAVYTLIDEVERFCISQGIELIEGPFNPNHYSELGLQVNQFGTPPTFFQTYNPDYYCKLLEGAGFYISARFHTRKNESVREYILQRYRTNTIPVAPDGYTVRSFSMRNIETELECIREVNNDAFSSNWHFLPLSKEEYLFSAKFLSLVTYPELIKIVEHHGRPVGVLHCVLDINPLLKRMGGKVGPISYIKFHRDRKKIRKFIIYSVAIKKAYQRTIVYRLLLNALCEITLKFGFQFIETTWMSEENTSAIKASEHLGLKPDKQFAIYEKTMKGEKDGKSIAS
ncbi:MAG: hypothetical protein OEZ31_07985 [Nitrospirota bacterium]|nr:hypothetical protein [Nitrospirota bacterium]MDH5768878.1 hypothetical protein [Nitrospirota bacterium]